MKSQGFNESLQGKISDVLGSLQKIPEITNYQKIILTLTLRGHRVSKNFERSNLSSHS